MMKRYCLKKDKHDHRDYHHTFKIHKHLAAFKEVDLRTHCPKVYDQGALGSCTANAIGGAYEFDEIKENEPDIFTPSRLFIYYNERVMEGTVNEDAGAEIRDGIKSINKVGVCPESMWEYDIKNFTVKPPEKLYDIARNHRSVEYKRVKQNLDQLKQCLIEGYPFIFGMQVYESFESESVKNTGIAPMPDTNKEKLLGGHAVLCVGFNDNKQTFIVRNSWGDQWGDKGYFYLPYEYLLSPGLVSDMWTVTKVVDNELPTVLFGL